MHTEFIYSTFMYNRVGKGLIGEKKDVMKENMFAPCQKYKDAHLLLLKVIDIFVIKFAHHCHRICHHQNRHIHSYMYLLPQPIETDICPFVKSKSSTPLSSLSIIN